ncbi:MAG: hypothetical protein GF331_10885 [Chitinivibrionales bacterium]|nr:hypothetical protein [Chitinivibrionales bacterium]
MKRLVMVLFNTALESRVSGVLEQQNVAAYTKVERVQGTGTHSVPHLGTHVWPALNHQLLIVLDATAVDGLLDALRVLKQEYPKEGLAAYVLPVEQTL